ncbi:MAG TPA: hypothetical protein VGG39_11440 [Polyangiaceae bacterium]|jgi:hypothetical protein
MTPQLEPHEVWAVVEAQADEDAAHDAEMRAIAAMSDADLEAELRKLGVDPDEVAGWAEAARDTSEARDERATSAGLTVPTGGPGIVADRAKDSARRRRLVLALAAAGAAAAAGGYVYGTRQPEPSPPVVPTVPTATVQPAPTSTAPRDAVAAAALRKRASAACDAKQWRECLALLDEAAEKDPAGDDASDVQAPVDARVLHRVHRVCAVGVREFPGRSRRFRAQPEEGTHAPHGGAEGRCGCQAQGDSPGAWHPWAEGEAFRDRKRDGSHRDSRDGFAGGGVCRDDVECFERTQHG